jgi:hypothetical protein
MLSGLIADYRAFHCRLYSCLANGSADEFQKGEFMFRSKAVNDALQIG